MCYEDGALQAYIDDELRDDGRILLEKHLEECSKCQERYEELKTIDLFVQQNMVLRDDNFQNIDFAWERLSKNIMTKQRGNKVLGAFSRYRKVFITTAAVFAIFALIFVGPVQDVAAEILSIFRVSKIEMVTLSIKDIEEIQRKFEEKGIKDIDLKQFGKVKVESNGGESIDDEDTIVNLPKVINFPFKIPRIAEDFSFSHGNVEKPMDIEITPNVSEINELISTFGGEKLFPKELNKKTFKISTKNVIQLNYNSNSDEKPSDINILQFGNPEIIVPPGVNIDEVREAALTLPFLPDNIKHQLANIKDVNTIPFFVDDEVKTKEVQINGNSGIYYEHSYSSDNRWAGIIWADGMGIYAVNGYNVSEKQVLDIARSMR